MNLEEYIEDYRELLSTEKQDNWARGDIAVEVTKLEETNKKAIKDFLIGTNETRSAFNQRRWVSEKFPDKKDRTLEGVLWTHYRVCAGTSDPKKWLLEAHDERLSVKELISRVTDEEDNAKIDSGLLCNECGNEFDKEDKVGLTYNKKRNLFCSRECTITYLTNL